MGRSDRCSSVGLRNLIISTEVHQTNFIIFELELRRCRGIRGLVCEEHEIEVTFK